MNTVNAPITAAHEQDECLHIAVEYPAHPPRTESAEFALNKRQLVTKLDTPCFSCGGKEAREVHHFVIEWAEADNADWAKVAKAVHHFDIYGFAAQLGDKPITSPDDIRNLVVICAKCHRGAGLGIHLVPFPNWISQVVARDGIVILKPPHSQTAGAVPAASEGA
jgi:hypothetical protein